MSVDFTYRQLWSSDCKALYNEDRSRKNKLHPRRGRGTTDISRGHQTSADRHAPGHHFGVKVQVQEEAGQDQQGHHDEGRHDAADVAAAAATAAPGPPHLGRLVVDREGVGRRRVVGELDARRAGARAVGRRRAEVGAAEEPGGAGLAFTAAARRHGGAGVKDAEGGVGRGEDRLGPAPSLVDRAGQLLWLEPRPAGGAPAAAAAARRRARPARRRSD